MDRCLTLLPPVIDTPSPTTLYAGTYAGGVFKSTNGGASWSAINSGLSGVYDVVALAIDPMTPSTLYASIDNLLYKTTNGGGTWSPVTTGLGGNRGLFPYIHSLAINPYLTGTLYAAADDGVYKSTDSAGSWTNILTRLSNARILSVAIDPHTPSILYTGTDGGVFKSTDGGGTWSPRNNDLTGNGILAIDPKTPNTLYLATYGSGVFKSTDSADTWTAVNAGIGGIYIFAVFLVIDRHRPGDKMRRESTGLVGGAASPNGIAVVKSAVAE